MNVLVRVAEVDDAEAIAVLGPQLGYEMTTEGVGSRIGRMGESRQVFVACADGRVLGWTSVHANEHFVEGLIAMVEGFIVDAAVRSLGIGALLLDAVEAWAREHGCATVRVQSNVVRDRAHAFYEHHGYSRVKSQHQFVKRFLP